MDRTSALVALRAVSALLLALGLAGVAVGAYSEATYDCESGYHYDALEVGASDVEGDAVAFENLSAPEQRAVRVALTDSTEPVESPADLPGDVDALTVHYRGDYYRITALVADCGDNLGVLFAFAGVPLAVLGLLGGLPSHLLLRRQG